MSLLVRMHNTYKHLKHPNTHTYIHTHTHTHTHIHTHTHTHTHTYKLTHTKTHTRTHPHACIYTLGDLQDVNAQDHRRRGEARA